MWLSLLACNEDPPKPADTARDSGDTGADPPQDADGDGFLDWRLAADPALADCDDEDPAVTPATERYIAAGTFTRGEAGLLWAEPVRALTLSAFCVDRFEVSNTDFAALLRDREAQGLSNVDDAGRTLYDVDDDDDIYPQRLQYDAGAWSIEAGYEDHPVCEVWYWSAELFCASVSKRLPTEAEWEKAARGPDDARRFPWGDTEADCGWANMALRDVETGGFAPCIDDTTPAGTYPLATSPYGSLDVSGNMAEWVSDWFAPDYYASAPESDPTGPAEGQLHDGGAGVWVARLTRGGNFLTPATDLRVSMRTPEPEDATSNGVGFRCVRPLR